MEELDAWGLFLWPQYSRSTFHSVTERETVFLGC